MQSATVRISLKSKRILHNLSSQTGKKMQEILDEAIDVYQQRQFLEKANAAFAALQSDPETWKEEKEERNAWEATLSDNLKD